MNTGLMKIAKFSWMTIRRVKEVSQGKYGLKQPIGMVLSIPKEELTFGRHFQRQSLKRSAPREIQLLVLKAGSGMPPLPSTRDGVSNIPPILGLYEQQ